MADIDDVIRNLEDHVKRRVAGLEALALNQAQEMEAFAKRNARWKDRTSNARQGLKGSASLEGKFIVIRIAHQVDYGLFLEKSFAGRYAIIKPTQRKYKAIIKTNITRYWKATKY